MERMTSLLERLSSAVNLAFPLKLLFQSFLKKGIFPVDWKKSNIVPVHKKKNLI